MAKLEFACSAVPLDLIPFLNFTAEQLAIIDGMPDLVLRESVRDLLSSQQFRREYWVKGRRKLPRQEQHDALRRERVMLATAPQDVPEGIRVPVGEVTLNKDIYGPILDCLARLGLPTIGELEACCSGRGMNIAQISQALVVLIGRGYVLSASDREAAMSCQRATGALNRHILNLGLMGRGVEFMASPVTGGGVSVNSIQQLFISGSMEGLNNPQALAEFAWKNLSLRGQKLLKEGKPIDTNDENVEELKVQAGKFIAGRAGVLKAFKVM